MPPHRRTPTVYFFTMLGKKMQLDVTGGKHGKVDNL